MGVVWSSREGSVKQYGLVGGSYGNCENRSIKFGTNCTQTVYN